VMGSDGCRQDGLLSALSRIPTTVARDANDCREHSCKSPRPGSSDCADR
jgi:hypothetical protein